MESVFLPFLLYYWIFGLLLPYWDWVVGSGIFLLLFLALWLRNAKALEIPGTVQFFVWAISVVGVFGTMPTSFLYGAIGGEAGANIGSLVDRTLNVEFPIFRLIFGLTTGIVSATALIVWALLIWGSLGAVAGFGIHIGQKKLRIRIG